MPEVQAGKGCTIGTTMTVRDKIVPNIVGVDIGCGVLTVKLKEKRLDLRSWTASFARTSLMGETYAKGPTGATGGWIFSGCAARK